MIIATTASRSVRGRQKRSDHRRITAQIPTPHLTFTNKCSNLWTLASHPCILSDRDSCQGGTPVSSHPIVHVELSANNREAAGKFYSDLFGWQVEDHPEMHYSTFTAGSGPARGFSQVADGMAQAGQTTVYV